MGTSVKPSWLKIDTGTESPFKECYLEPRITDGASIKDFTIEGSFDNKEWFVLAENKDVIPITGLRLAFDHVQPYRYYRINAKEYKTFTAVGMFNLGGGKSTYVDCMLVKADVNTLFEKKDCFTFMFNTNKIRILNLDKPITKIVGIY